jgi:PAS domain-containing protein
MHVPFQLAPPTSWPLVADTKAHPAALRSEPAAAQVKAAVRPEPTLSIGEVAALVGETPHTLRAWERRIGIVQPRRSGSNHRRYSLEDVERLIRVKRTRLARGVSLTLAAQEVEAVIPTLPLPGGIVGDLPLASPHTTDGLTDVDAMTWRLVADLLSQLVLVLDNRGRILNANVAVARLLNLTRGAVRNLMLADLVDPHDRAKAVVLYRSPIERHRGWELHLRRGKTVGLWSFDSQAAVVKGTMVVVLFGSPVSGLAENDW